jgi:hypothetical protein
VSHDDGLCQPRAGCGPGRASPARLVADDFDPSNRFEQVLPTRGSQRAGDGMHVAWLDHVRYERRADHHPDEIVVLDAVCSRSEAVISFQRGRGGEAEEDRPSLRLDHSARESSPLAERRGSGHGHSVLWRFCYRSRGG